MTIEDKYLEKCLKPSDINENNNGMTFLIKHQQTI